MRRAAMSCSAKLNCAALRPASAFSAMPLTSYLRGLPHTKYDKRIEIRNQ